MTELITPDNPLQPRHAGMMAVLANRLVVGPIWWDPCGDSVWPVFFWARRWSRFGYAGSGFTPHDIIAVLPMPDLSELEGE